MEHRNNNNNVLHAESIARRLNVTGTGECHGNNTSNGIGNVATTNNGFNGSITNGGEQRTVSRNNVTFHQASGERSPTSNG